MRIGNQLLYITDTAPAGTPSHSTDFREYSKITTAEYIYNANGVMTKDLNKGIQGIKYNTLNLPQEMAISNTTDRAKHYYTYTASGTKLKAIYRSDGALMGTPVLGSTPENDGLRPVMTKDYTGNKIYEDGILKTILTDNGYIEGNTYYFYVKDHLGNNRVVANASGTSIQSNQYYPFGMAFAEGSATEQEKQPYKYNGKELDIMHGLNMYDYSARHFSPDVPRFSTMDPHAENYYSWSPYVYCFNNPLRFIDPNGKDGWDIFFGISDAMYNNSSWGGTDFAGLNKESYQVNSSADYNAGRSIGDAVSVVMGAIEIINGGIAAGGGTATAPTGVGVGVAVAGAAAVGHGIGTISKALQGNGKMEMNDNAKSERSSSSSDTSGGGKNNTSSENASKGTLSETKAAVKEAQEKVGGSLPKGEPGKKGSPQRGDSRKGYRLDPGHPNRPAGDPETGPHVNWWDYTNGKRGAGGNSGAIPIKK